MQKLDNIKDILLQLLKSDAEIYSIVGKVIAIDEAKRVLDIEPVNGDANILDVRLQTKNNSLTGLVLFPKIGTQVTVTFMSKELAFVSKTEIIESVLLDIDGFSLMINKENFENTVKNKKNNIENYELNGKNTIFTLETLFEVISGGEIKLTAPNLIIQAITDITGATTINGVTTINGATTLNGVLSVVGAATFAGGIAVAGGAALSGGVVVNGGGNGGVPLGSQIKTKLDEIKTDINTLKNIFSSWTPVYKDGGAALKAAASGWSSSSLSPTSINDISNPNFTQ